MADNDSGEECTPPALKEIAFNVQQETLPRKSLKRYKLVYEGYKKWQAQNNVMKTSENVLVAFFGEHAKTKKSSTLWATYSILKTMLLNQENIDVSSFNKLQAFLKSKNCGYVAKKSKVFTGLEVQEFLTNADDNNYLAMKVVAIFGVSGACRGGEFLKIMQNDVSIQNDYILVSVRETKTGVPRSFIIKNEMMKVVKKYHDLRPNTATGRFFIKYRNGRCFNQLMGKNTFQNIPKTIAKFLNLPNASEYTGHSFRRTAATLLADAGGDISALKRLGGWKSSTVAEGYIDQSRASKESSFNLINNMIQQAAPSDAEPSNAEPSNAKPSDLGPRSENSDFPGLTFINCQNCVLNFTFNK